MVDSSSTMRELYQDNLVNKYTNLPEKALFNIVDISLPDNKWFEEWLCPIYVPLTCVFSSSGELLDLIPGMSYEGFSYMEKTIKDERISPEFPCRNRFSMNKSEYVIFMNDILSLDKYELCIEIGGE